MAARVSRPQLRRDDCGRRFHRAWTRRSGRALGHAIANSGLSFYNGDKCPAWKGNALVGAMRAGTGQFVVRAIFNAQGLPTDRVSMLNELKQRIRDVRPGPDGSSMC